MRRVDRRRKVLGKLMMNPCRIDSISGEIRRKCFTALVQNHLFLFIPTAGVDSMTDGRRSLVKGTILL
jgi:hypothetical protein